MHTYDEMIRRANDTPELHAYRDTILYDWPNADEHQVWICTAPIAEIVGWGEAVEQD